MSPDSSAIRDTDGNVYGIMIAATLGQHTFPEYSLQLFSDVSAQMGAVLRKCGHFKEKTNHVRALKHASKEMLDIVNERELKNVLDHINNRVSSFMCCSRAVLPFSCSRCCAAFAEDGVVGIGAFLAAAMLGKCMANTWQLHGICMAST